MKKKYVLRNNRYGFTLVELLVVMGIIAMLAVMGGANYITSLRRGRDATRRSDLEQVRAALEMYRTDFGVYPPCASTTSCDTNGYELAAQELVDEGYLKEVLLDPLNGAFYAYEVDDETVVTTDMGLTYQLCADLEIDPELDGCALTIADGPDPDPDPDDSGHDYGVTEP